MSENPEIYTGPMSPQMLPPQPPGSTVKVERWMWTLCTNAHESAVELWRDDDLRVTVPLTADQTELLLGHPHTLASAMEGFPGIADDGDPDAPEP